jgi:PAS domain S-box-containing protein
VKVERLANRPEGTSKKELSGIAPGRVGSLILWPTLGVLSLVLCSFAVVLRMMGGRGYDPILVLASAVAAAVLALRLAAKTRVATLPIVAGSDTHKDLLDSSGPAVVALGLDGRLLYANPASERLLGYNASEFANQWKTIDILAPGEGVRLVAEMQKLAGVERLPRNTPEEGLATYVECLRALPPSMVPSFDAQILRRGGEAFPATLHISAMRDGNGSMTGLVAVAVDQTATLRQEEASRESLERYRDLFENSTEMIATISPSGRFLYVNPAWKRCFGLEDTALLNLESFEDLFSAGGRGDVSALFRRALEGEMVDRAPLRHHTPDGRVLEFELSLSQRQKAGNPLAVRCLLRDVTQQKQRENRLALQIAVSQIVGENASPEVASMRILEALCISQEWDVAIEWLVDSKGSRLEFSTAWGAPGRRPEALIQESMGLSLERGTDLPGQAWKEGRPVWVQDLNAVQASSRVKLAMSQKMVSSWAIPVRFGHRALAVLEFFSHYHLREDRESMAVIETAASTLGQMLARTHEKGRAEELSRQQEILLDSVADGIFGVDNRGMISFANPAAARMLGTEAEALKGKPVHEVLHGAARPGKKCPEDCPLRRNTGHARAAAGEDTIFKADGNAFPAEYVLTPIANQGRFAGSVLSFRDISQRYALDRLKDEFISTVSHELRTPLTSIRGALGLLSSGILGDVNDKAANLLRIALTNSDRLVRLINDILDLERIQSGREPLLFRTIQLAELVRQAIDGMQPVAEAAGVQLIHDTTHVELAADPDRLLQVLTNLLSNAIKFSPPNSTVSIMMRPGLAGVTMSVIDQGRGIPADKLEAIFGRFQQVDASDSRQKGGSGLGLAICRTIVLQHSGRIWAERNPVRGSTFRVFLPYQPAQPEPGTPVEHEETMGSGIVLLAGVAGEAHTRMADQLTRHGFKVVATSTIEETMKAALDPVHAILLDTSLDGMNGWEILPKLREVDGEGRVPIVLLCVDDAHVATDLPDGAEGRLVAPVEEDALLSELARVFCGEGKKARILIVEDDVDLAGVIAAVFTRDGIEVKLAHTLHDATESCTKFEPHLMVLDIGLPDGNGFNVVDWLRQHENLSHLPLVIYSGRDLSPAERRMLTLGPTHFLAKARVQPQQLEALVLTMLRQTRMMDEVASPDSKVPNT